jgi:hypothetical protein
MRIKQRVYKAFFTESEVDKIEQIVGEIPHKLTDEIEIGCKCDVCEKQIERGSFFFRVLTGHRDWGNDSCESQKWFDICSQECLQAMYKKFDTMSDATKYIEISRERM